MPRSSSTFTMRILADTTQLVKSLGKVEARLNGFAKAAKITGGLFAASFAARPLTEFLQDSIKAASDMEEALSKVNVVFGDSSAVIDEWAQGAVQAMGLSTGAALEASGTFGNLLVSFGVGEREAAKMSKTLVQLAADLASFNNTSVEDAILALRSGLSGETEPLKRYGIVLQDTRLRQEAMAQGLKVTSAALDPLVKSQAAYSLILQDSATAQGDFQRTSEGLANTQRIFAASIVAAKEEIGIGLLSAIKDVSQAIGGSGGLSESIGDVAEDIGDFTRGIGLMISELVKYNDQIDKAIGLTNTLGWIWRIGIGISTAGLSESIIFATKKTMENGEEVRKNEENIKLWDRASKIAAANIRGQFIPAQVQLQKELRATANEARAAAADILATFGGASGARTARQMDSFGREIDKQSIYWKNAADESKRYWESLNREVGGGGGSSGSKVTYALEGLKNLTKKQFDGINKNLENFVDRWQGDFDKWTGELDDANEYVKRWQQDLTRNLDIGRAFTNANDAQAKEADALAELNRVMSDPKASADAINNARDAYRTAAAAAAVSWQESFANELKDAKTFYNVLGQLKDTGLNETLMTQIANLGPGVGTELAKELLGDRGLIGQLNNDWADVTNAARDLGIGMSDTFQEIGYTQASNMVDALITQIGRDARKVKKAIKKDFSTTVTIKYIADTSGLPAFGNSTAVAQGGFTRSSTSRGRQIVEDIQAYELVSGRSWRV